MVNLDLECRLALQRKEELRRTAERQHQLRAALTPRAADRPPARVASPRPAPELRQERA